MRRNLISFTLMIMFVLVLAMPAAATQPLADVARWDFNVYLNDKRVGTHIYEVAEVDGVKTVRSEAEFNYRILFIPAYRYQHTNSERWADNCLLTFEARTNANGDRIEVRGEKTGDGFMVKSGAEPTELPECVMSFAYWNPEFLDAQRLLNPQTGEYVDVSVEQIAEEMLEVRGEPVPATRFRLTAYEVDLTLWYSQDNEWLALESVAKGGHIIRYELS